MVALSEEELLTTLLASKCLSASRTLSFDICVPQERPSGAAREERLAARAGRTVTKVTRMLASMVDWYLVRVDLAAVDGGKQSIALHSLYKYAPSTWSADRN